MGKRVLITGSAGFVYSNFIIHAIQETDWELVSIDKLTYAGSLKNVPQNKRHKLYIGDICDKHLVDKVFDLERPDIVVHGAAESMVDRSIEDSSAFINTNVLGTQVMLDAALKYKVKLFLNTSTDEVYGSLDTGSAAESSPLKPRNPYSASKAAADLLGQSYFHTHGLRVITTRCSNNFGPRQHTEKFIPKAITNLIKDVQIPLYGKGLNQRDWLYTKDKFYALKLLIETGKAGEVYNIGTGQERTNIDILKLILAEFQKGEECIQYVKDRPGHDFRYSVDCSKLKALGWEPKYQFEEAIKHCVGWYKANPWSWR
jgi:dTDP-glucose 4,6-dehydratase